MPKQIQEDVNKIELAPAELVGRGIETTCHKLSGHFNVNFQPLRLNNYSEKLFTVAYESEGVIRHCDFLRFGTPTLELVGKPVELEGAFVLFLNSLKEKGESILSVQLQNRAPKNFLLGDESERVELIIKTASNPRYKDCLKVLALPEDSKFFKQADHEHLTNAEDFKEALLNQVIGEDEDSLFLLPIQDAEKIQVVRDIETLIESVHMRFYNSKKQLEASERHTFQKRLYADLMFYFVAYHQPTFAHAQCKDAMDRAMSLITTFYHQTLMHQREVDLSSRQNELRVLTHGAALLIKGCPMHGERFQTLMHILNQNERIKTEGGDLTAHQWHVKGKSFKLTSIDIDKDPRLLFNKLPSQAASLDEYQERLTEEQYVESSLADLEPLEPEAAKAQLKRDLNNMLFLRDGHMPDCDYSQEAQEAIGHHGSDLGGMANVSAEIKQSIIEARYRNWIDVQTLDREEILGYLGQQLAVPLTDLAMQMYLNIDLNIAVPCLSEGSIAGTVLNVVGSLDASVLEVYQTFVIKNTDTGETIAYLKARAQYSVQTLKGQAQFKVQQDKPTCFELFDGKRTEALHRGTNA